MSVESLLLDSLFFGTEGPRDARILVVGEAWGAEEARLKRPFANPHGAGGLYTQMLASADINRGDELDDGSFVAGDVLTTNLIAERPAGNDMKQFFYRTADVKKLGLHPYKGLYPKENLLVELQRLQALIAHVRPEVIIALGNYPLWALTNACVKIKNSQRPQPGWKIPTGIVNWRGSQLYTSEDFGSIPLVPTYHPAAVLRNWSWLVDSEEDLRHTKRLQSDGRWNEPSYRFYTRPSYDAILIKLQTLYDEAERTGALQLAVDCETPNNWISCITIAWNKLEAICIPFRDPTRPLGYWTGREEAEIVAAIRRLLSSPWVKIIGQNFNYDNQFFVREFFFIPDVDFDCMTAQHLLFPGKPKSLDYQSSLYCEYHVFWKDEGREWDMSQPIEVHWNYACKDAVITFEVAQVEDELIHKFDLEEQFSEQMEFFHLGRDIMLEGILVDTKERNKLAIQLMDQIFEHETRLYNIMDWFVPSGKSKTAWYNSFQQQVELFYDVLCVKPVIDKATKGRTVKDSALETLKVREPILRPVFELLQEYRSLQKFYTNFVQAKLEPDGRMHCMVNTAQPETFRWSMSKNAYNRACNMQTIPKGHEVERIG